MKTTIHYKNHTPALSDGFYHPDCPLLFADHDQITRLSDCPFPLKTDSFKVLLFGKSKTKPGDTFAVVEYQKTCGHTVQERITFCEGVEDFTHGGSRFVGAEYSIQNWKARVEWFRTNLPCDVCQMVHHALWCYAGGISTHGNSRKKALDSLRHLLDYNFANWTDFVEWADIERRFQATRYASDRIAA